MATKICISFYACMHACMYACMIGESGNNESWISTYFASMRTTAQCTLLDHNSKYEALLKCIKFNFFGAACRLWKIFTPPTNICTTLSTINQLSLN